MPNPFSFLDPKKESPNSILTPLPSKIWSDPVAPITKAPTSVWDSTSRTWKPEGWKASNPLAAPITGTSTLPSTENQQQGSLTDFSNVMRAVSKSVYQDRQGKEGKVTAGQFDPTKVSGSIFKQIMNSVESSRGSDISKVYGSAVDAAKFDIEKKEQARKFDAELAQKKEEYYGDHPELNYGFSTSNDMRTDRHMNPTAFTTDIAKQAGLVEGVDYTIGDAFPNNPNLFTAKLLGNPIETTIRVIDKIGFMTQSGDARWTYTNAIAGANNQAWQKLGFADKAQVIKEMYRHEGGNGSLFGIKSGEKALTTQQSSALNSIAGSFDNELLVRTFGKLQEANTFIKSLAKDSSNPADDQGLIYSFAKAMDPDSVVREGEYATVQKYAQQWTASFGYDVMRVVNNQEFLTQKARENIKMTVEKKFEASKKSYDNIFNEYSRRINERLNINDGAKYLTQYSFGASDYSDSEMSSVKNKYGINY
jgi:hypothetical protein